LTQDTSAYFSLYGSIAKCGTRQAISETRNASSETYYGTGSAAEVRESLIIECADVILCTLVVE